MEHEFYFHRDSVKENNGKVTMKKHCHSLFEIYFITSGNCCYFIEDKTYHLSAGDMILIPAGVMHNTEYKNTIHTRLLINCSEWFIPDSVKALFPRLLFLYRNPNVVGELISLFQKIENEIINKDSLSNDILRCYTNNLFFIIARNPNLFVSESNTKHYLDDAIEFIQNNYASPITLSSISKRYFVSAEHFSRVFKSKTGFNFSEYVNIVRLQKAEAMLKQLNTAQITEVASACGFNDSNYFSLKFKELYGISPKKFQLLNDKK